MTPTNELRFVEREIDVVMDWHLVGTTACTMKKTVRVLQRKWVGPSQYVDSPEVFEWRDVPLVKEEA